MRRYLGTALVVLTLLVAGAVAAPEGTSARTAAQQKKRKQQAEAAAQSDYFTGVLVPLNATDLLAPESGFRIAGWNSWGGWLKLTELTADGKEVKAGEVIARFEFNGKDALRHVNERLQRAQADRAQAQISTEQTLDGLRVDQRRRQLEAQLAALDVQKERAISRRQADLYRIAQKIAAFEAEAVTQRLSSAVRARDAELAFHEESVQRSEQELGRYKFYENRFKVVAPHAGVVRHAFNPRERRKFEKGDGIGSGQRLLSVARDARLAVRFFVPEHRVFELKEGDEVTVISPASGEEHLAVIKRIEFFPQELGFLMELPNLPNAREKAFAVMAEFKGAPEGLSAGTELRVKGKGKGKKQ